MQQREANRRRQERMQEIKQEQMREVTGQPVITQRGERVQGARDRARIEWKRLKDEKVHRMKAVKASQERDREERERNKQGKYVNKQSEKYLSRKENYNSQIPTLVEDRLLTFGQLS